MVEKSEINFEKRDELCFHILNEKIFDFANHKFNSKRN